jgi:hypothetical protein
MTRLCEESEKKQETGAMTQKATRGIRQQDESTRNEYGRVQHTTGCVRTETARHLEVVQSFWTTVLLCVKPPASYSSKLPIAGGTPRAGGQRKQAASWWYFSVLTLPPERLTEARFARSTTA